MEEELDGDDAFEGSPPGESSNPLAAYSVEALSRMLEEVLEEENYERAAEIRDEIDRRKEQD